MALITLLTDFGTQDEYVGVMKGVIAGINPDVRIVDICHYIEPQNIVHGAFILAAACPYFPPGSVHVGIVDPGVGTARRILALEHDGQRFVVPDNGLIERVLATGAPASVVAVEASAYFLDRVSRTFHGRDIFAPVAAHLAAGLPLAELGPAVDHRTLVRGVVPETHWLHPNAIEGVVVAADHFGNLMTNIDAATIDRLVRRFDGEQIVVELSGRPLGGIVASYGSVAKRMPLAVIGSRGVLEISVNCGNARQMLNAELGDRVCVRVDGAAPSDKS